MESSEYKHNNEVWIVEDFSILTSLFPGLTERTMPALHALCTSRKDFEMPWGMLRRLSGIRQAIIPIDVDASKLHPMSREQVAEIFQTTKDEVALSIALLQAAWRQITTEAEMPEYVPPLEKPKKRGRPTNAARAAAKAAEDKAALALAGSEERVEFTNEQIELLDMANYPTKIFDLPGQNLHDKYAEVEWFCDLIRDVKRVFEEPMAKSLMHWALLNQLQLRRINMKLMVMDATDPQFNRLQGMKQELETTYGIQWSQIEQLCPTAAASVTRRSMINTFGDIVKEYQKYKADPTNRVRDGVFTDEEIQIQFRTSLQIPDVSYRRGWVAAVREAMIGLDDPAWKRRMPQDMCQILDAAVQYAARKMQERLNIPRPDLEAQGPAGEYPPLYQKDDGVKSELTFEDIMQSNANDEVPIGEMQDLGQIGEVAAA